MKFMRQIKFVSLVLPIFVAFVGVNAFSQNRTTITGVVSDQNGEPLPGASIVIKGTTTGSTASIDGAYSIYAEKGDVLIFSYVGMNSLEVKVMEATVINATLPDFVRFLRHQVAHIENQSVR